MPGDHLAGNPPQGDRPPARSTVGVSTLPKNARVEIEAIAFDESAAAGGKTASDTSG